MAILRREMAEMREHNWLLLNLWVADATPGFTIKEGKLEPMDFSHSLREPCGADCLALRW